MAVIIHGEEVWQCTVCIADSAISLEEQWLCINAPRHCNSGSHQKLEQKCSGSYMHEWQQGCSHERRVQPALRKKKTADAKLKCLVKIDFLQCEQRYQHRNIAESHKVPSYFSTSITSYRALLSIFSADLLMHQSSHMSFLIQCWGCDRVKSKRLNLSLSLSVNQINSEHWILQ